jgi:hypothetical protein
MESLGDIHFLLALCLIIEGCKLVLLLGTFCEKGQNLEAVEIISKWSLKVDVDNVERRIFCGFVCFHSRVLLNLIEIFRCQVSGS